jgi:hypothetical protein
MLQNFSLRLRYPDLPLIEVKNGAFYPLECVTIREVS